jgi:hypothetical protein
MTAVSEILKERRVGDGGRILVALKAMDAEQEGPVEEEVFHSIMFLLDGLRIVPTGYRFGFRPLPYSAGMDEDLAQLSSTGFVSHRSPIWITEEGDAWVHEKLGESEATALSYIKNQVSSWTKLDRAQLFDMAYLVYTQR